MYVERAFHFWFYAALAMASVCLALPTTFFVPGMPLLLLAILVLIALAWRKEGVWILSEAAANQLGIFIAIGAAVWVVFQIPRSDEDLIATGVPWPAGMLPHLGPVLMVLLVVKLFRPKRLPDFWVLQTIGLMMVTLAAVLADTMSFGCVFILYLASLVACLACYTPIREQRQLNHQEAAGAAPLFAREALPAALPGRATFGLLGRVLRWTALALVAGFLFFLIAPRQATSHWVASQLSQAGSTQLRTGAELGIDLNRTGRIELSEEPAFEVRVFDADGPVMSLPADQHWQLEIYDYYHLGRWYPLTVAQERFRVTRVAETLTRPVRPAPETVKPGELLFTFDVKPARSGGLIVAEPADPNWIGLGPSVDDQPNRLGFFGMVDGCDLPLSVYPGRRRSYKYSQVLVVPKEPNRFPASVIQKDYRQLLTSQGAPVELKTWTRELLNRLPELRRTGHRLDEDGSMPPKSHAAAAQALCNHLARSGAFLYSLDLRRIDTELDPIVDFLFNVREGHCERYAAGLALMLRSVDIPARVVKGYRGAGGAGGAGGAETGSFVLLQSQAHSWVQALVPSATGGSQWLILEPTPDSDASLSLLDSWRRWFNESFDSRVLWRQFIMEYNPEVQAVAAEQLGKQLATPQGLATLLAPFVVFATYWLGRRGWRRLLALRAERLARPAHPTPESALYGDLLKVLRRKVHLAPAMGQTPREFGTLAAAVLALRADTLELADLPNRVAAAHYQAKFGLQPLNGAERALLEMEVRELSVCFRKRPNLSGEHTRRGRGAMQPRGIPSTASKFAG